MPESRSLRTYGLIILWGGVLAVVANGFLVQELIRFVSTVMDSVSIGKPMRGGWLTLSRAAVPASWVYWVSHAWLICAAIQLRQRGETQPSVTVRVWLPKLMLVVGLEVLAIHAMALMIRPYWRLTPSLW